MSTHAAEFYTVLSEVLRLRALPVHGLMVEELVALRARGGRLFCLGVGGGAANAAHAVCDFRKLCGIEAYAPTDGIAELTARANDDGWATVFVEWLRRSNLRSGDGIFVFSVGGGHLDVSVCIRDALQYVRTLVDGVRVLGVVALPTGATAVLGDAVVVTHLTGQMRTPVTEAVQVAVLHALVSDPRLRVGRTKW